VIDELAQHALRANWDLLVAILLLPQSPWVLGALFGGLKWGTAKDRTALVEVLRGALVAGGVGMAVWAMQVISRGTP